MNILSGISGSTPPPSPTRTHADTESFIPEKSSGDVPKRSNSRNAGIETEEIVSLDEMAIIKQEEADDAYANGSAALEAIDEKTPLLDEQRVETFSEKQSLSKRSRWFIPKRITSAIIGVVKVVVSTITYPGRWVLACFYDEQGHFSALLPVFKLGRVFGRKRNSTAKHVGVAATSNVSSREGSKRKPRSTARIKRTPSESSAAVTSESEADNAQPENDGPARHTRSKSIPSANEEIIAPAKRSIRIKLSSDEALKQRKQRSKQQSANTPPNVSGTAAEIAAAALKSPTGGATSGNTLTRYPRAPAPPRPLIPRRQPSYSSNAFAPERHEKTLVLDLDETLIHSMSKGGRYTTGHMVEVRMRHTIGVGGMALGPEVPVLYYVHKRPYCDDFLRKVSKWYNLVIFTASVQEYADPVIDWLELERKYFVRRYYRDQCTYRNGAYIKDMGIVESDLSKVMIIDNSPMSYMFNEDNAIPIEGWISDPTDYDLMHLIPLLEGLQYVTDVRAVLALRLGEPQTA